MHGSCSCTFITFIWNEKLAGSCSWTPYTLPAATAFVFSFHIRGVTPHSWSNFSAAHKILWKPQSHVFCIFLLFVPIYSIWVSFHSLCPSLAHKQSVLLSYFMGPFSPHESIPFRCIWGYGCHWQPAVREWQSLSVLGVSSTQRSYWWSCCIDTKPLKAMVCNNDSQGSLILWPTHVKSSDCDILY